MRMTSTDRNGPRSAGGLVHLGHPTCTLDSTADSPRSTHPTLDPNHRLSTASPKATPSRYSRVRSSSCERVSFWFSLDLVLNRFLYFVVTSVYLIVHMAHILSYFETSKDSLVLTCELIRPSWLGKQAYALEPYSFLMPPLSQLGIDFLYTFVLCLPLNFHVNFVFCLIIHLLFLND